ncbi:SMI1/KNR4 family protein [Kribbella sp. NPDC020789]
MDRLTVAWGRYVRWLAGASERLSGDLLPGATAAELAAFETSVGMEVPAELRELWALCGGQATIDAGVGVFPGLDFLGPGAASKEWLMWRRLRDESPADEMAELSSLATSRPAGAIAASYSCAGWIPVWRMEMAPDYVGIDLEPGPTGTVGQIITFGRDQDDKVVVAESLAEVVEFFASAAERGQLRVVTDPKSGDSYLRHEAGPIGSVLSGV